MIKGSSTPPRRFALGFLGAFCVLLFCSFSLNTWINPLWITPAPWTDSGFADYKPIHKQMRTGKAGLAMQGGWEGLIIGSSRLDIAIDPLDEQWQGKPTVNLGLRGGNLCEFEPLIELALDYNHPEIVVIGVDHYDLTSTILIPNPAVFEESALSKSRAPLERRLRDHLGGSSLELSVKAINYRVRERLASYNRYGQWANRLDGRPFRDIFITDSMTQAREWIRLSSISNVAVPEKLDALASILAQCQDQGVRVIVLIPPNHAAYLSAFFIGNAVDPTFDTNRRLLFDVVEQANQTNPDAPAVEAWDFCDFHPINCEAISDASTGAGMNYWIDGTHATATVGSLMLQAVLRGEATIPEGYELPYGTRLTRDSLQAASQHVSEGYIRYKELHPLDWQWVKELLDQNPVVIKQPAQPTTP